MERLKVNVPVGILTEDNLEHCAVALYKELPWGHTVVGEANASQHSFQLVTCSRQICLRGGRGWGEEGEGEKGNLLDHLHAKQIKVGAVIPTLPPVQ